MFFSIIIPVYNRPNEVNELLESLSQTTYKDDIEVVIIEDGSKEKCDLVANKYADKLQISYYYKENTGPGNSRNFGMQKAKGDYFIIFDSDCIIPKNYLTEVATSLQNDYVACFGGPDNALDSFTDIQKAINFAMTSFLTTGGIRGGSEKINTFQPRSFNMGISKEAFEVSGGFGTIHPGEDPDLTIRLWDLSFRTKLIPTAFVYHKRRIDWNKFLIQVTKFGKARPILNYWHPKYSKITYFFPTLFILGLFCSIALFVIGISFYLKMYFLYFVVLFCTATLQNKSIKVGLMALIAVGVQFYGYGTGFLKSFIKINILKQKPKEAFPELFF